MSNEYPKSKDEKIQLLSEILTSYANQENLNFIIESQELYNQEVFGFFGCLPLLLLDAKDNYEKIYNQNFSSVDLMSAYRKKNSSSNETNTEEMDKIDDEKIKKMFPIVFMDNEEAFFNAEPVLDKNSNFPFVILSHFVHHAVEEYVNQYKLNPSLLINGKIPLDSLYAKWSKYILSNKIEIKPVVPDNNLSIK